MHRTITTIIIALLSGSAGGFMGMLASLFLKEHSSFVPEGLTAGAVSGLIVGIIYTSKTLAIKISIIGRIFIGTLYGTIAGTISSGCVVIELLIHRMSVNPLSVGADTILIFGIATGTILGFIGAIPLAFYKRPV